MLLLFGEDAMNEAGWCYLEGFGCKKDKVRLMLGNGNPPAQPPYILSSIIPGSAVRSMCPSPDS